MQINRAHLNDISRAIKVVIEDYLAGHRTRSLATLARQSGISYTTLRRMAQREGAPTAEPVLKVIDVALDGKARALFLTQYFPEISRVAGFVGSESATQGESNAVLKPFYSRDPHCLILLLAQNQSGTDVKTIERLCGEAGPLAIRELRDAGLISIDDDSKRIELLVGTSIHLDIDMILNCMRTSIARFDRSLLGSEAARAGHLTGGVSLEGLDRIRQIVTEALTEIAAIKENSRYFGPIPFFCNMLLNVFDRTVYLRESNQNSAEVNHDIH